MGKKLRIAVLLSGSGTTLQNLIDKSRAGELPAEVVAVISSRKDAYGIVRAQDAGIPSFAVPSRKYDNWEEHSKAVTAILDRFSPDLIVTAGYMCLYVIPPQYEGKLINVHPALIPSFCGKGLYGHLVHEAVIEHGVRVTGCTVHFVNNQYDAGPIILQRIVPVRYDDTPDTVAERVMAEERIALPEAIRLCAEGRLAVDGGRVRVLQGQWTPTSLCGF